MSQPAIVFNNVCFSYTNQEVLHDISLSIEPNSFTGVVGPNGGGKTTLLRLILGLERPDKGSISVFDSKPKNVRNRIGYVMQHMAYDENFPATVLDITLMGRANRHTFGPYKSKDRLIALNSLLRVEMAGFENRPFSDLSGGERQRVLIAQALCGEPELLLLDEPTANIDSAGEQAIHKLLNTLASNLTVITVSHNVNTVLKCASHVLCVNKTAALSPLDKLHPDTLAKAYGGDLAVLHHELTCQVFDKSGTDSCDHNHSKTHKSKENV